MQIRFCGLKVSSFKYLKIITLCGLLTTSMLIVNKPVYSMPSDSGFSSTPTFQDEFNGTSLDTNNWDYRIGARKDGYNRLENVSVSDGYLNIALKQEDYGGKNYTCGGVISKYPNIFKYGYYETRAKLTDKPGWHSAFWLMGTNGVVMQNEIDGFECDSDIPTIFSSSAHYYSKNYKDRYYGGIDSSEVVNTATDFHVYGWEWTPTEVIFYVDGKLIGKIDYPGPHAAQNVWLTSLAMDRGYGIQGDTSISFDYFRYYQRDYGPEVQGNSIVIDNADSKSNSIIVIDNGDSNYTETGIWAVSSLKGYNGMISKYAYGKAGTINSKWNLGLVEGNYRVYIYKVVHSNSDPKAKIDIVHSRGTTTKYLNYTTGQSSWVDLGVYDFSMEKDGYVMNTLNTNNKVIRADAVKFVREP